MVPFENTIITAAIAQRMKHAMSPYMPPFSLQNILPTMENKNNDASKQRIMINSLDIHLAYNPSPRSLHEECIFPLRLPIKSGL